MKILSQSKDAQPANLRIQLDDIKSEEEIDSLDIKSLKRLLLNNFVDYKGCREKWELQDRLKRLWKDNEVNKKKCKQYSKTCPKQPLKNRQNESLKNRW